MVTCPVQVSAGRISDIAWEVRVNIVRAEAVGYLLANACRSIH